MTTFQSPSDIIFLKIGEYLLRPEDVLLLAGYGNYTKAILVDGSTLISTRNLAVHEKNATKFGFFRIHKSFIINKKYLSRIDKRCVFLENHLAPIPVARRRWCQFVKPNHVSK